MGLSRNKKSDIRRQKTEGGEAAAAAEKPEEGSTEKSGSGKKRGLTGILLILMFLLGLGITVYPPLANFINSKTQSKAITNYNTVLKTLKDEDCKVFFDAADEYNGKLAKIENPFACHDKVPDYDSTLNVSGTGIMGYIHIEKIKVELPIYHGISAPVLNIAVGHIPGSTLPVGGKGTHCVLSAHRGLPSARLFSDLDKLEEGDIFEINILNRCLTYRVDLISIVEPNNIEQLQVFPGKDYCTLCTCTPYGINSHRLLVRGERTSPEEKKKPKPFVPSEAHRISPLIVAPIVAAPVLLTLFIWLFFAPKRRRKK